MRSTQQFSITWPNEMADVVKAKVATGEYATESEVIRDGLRMLWPVITPWRPGCASRSSRWPKRSKTRPNVRAVGRSGARAPGREAP